MPAPQPSLVPRVRLHVADCAAQDILLLKVCVSPLSLSVCFWLTLIALRSELLKWESVARHRRWGYIHIPLFVVAYLKRVWASQTAQIREILESFEPVDLDWSIIASETNAVVEPGVEVTFNVGVACLPPAVKY